MAKTSKLTSEEGEGTKRNGPWLPILLFLLLLAAAIYCAWLLWSQYAQSRQARAEDEARLELLLKQKKELEDLLKLPPCEASGKAGHILLPSTLPAPHKNSSAGEGAGKKTADGNAQYGEGPGPDNIEAACVFLVSLAEGNKLSTGSGFFIAPGYIATNRHVLGANPGRILVTSKALGHPVAGRLVAQGSGKDEDFAIVEVNVPDGARIVPLGLASGIKKTQKVGAWGFPNVIGKNDPAYASLLRGENINAIPELSYSEGVVSAVLDRTPRLIVHTAPISPGNSGGPLLDGEGRVVGINTMITLDEDSYRQASLALPADALAKFIRENGISLP